jgi:hypothetical protein
MTSKRSEFEAEMLAKISDDPELLSMIEGVPGEIADTVRAFTPVDTGRTRDSISIQSRKTALRRLSTRRVKVGSVFSDDDPKRVAAIEYGRGADAEHGETPEHAMFRRAVAAWIDRDL